MIHFLHGVPQDRADRGAPRGRARADRRRRARPGGGGRLRVGERPGGRRPRGRRNRQRVPPLPLEGRAVRRGVPPPGHPGARRARGDRDTRLAPRSSGWPRPPRCWHAARSPPPRSRTPRSRSRSSRRSRPSGSCLRRGYRDAFARILEDGIERGELEPHDTQTYGAAILGAISEALVGPAQRPEAKDHEALIASLVQFTTGRVRARRMTS